MPWLFSLTEILFTVVLFLTTKENEEPNDFSCYTEHEIPGTKH